MTASLSPDPMNVAPQAMSEQHTTVVDDIQKREIWRFWMLVFFFSALAVFVMVPLTVHQVFQFGQAPAPGLPHQGQSPRGVIVDSKGALLAADRYFYQVTTTPDLLTSDDARISVAQQLEELADIPYAATLDKLSTYRELKYIELAPTISQEAGQRILDKQAALAKDSGMDPLLQVNLTPVPKRYYPEGTLAAHLLGILARKHDDDAFLEGLYGVEGYFDNFLRQRDGAKLTDSRGAKLQDLPEATRRFLPSVAGKDLVLTIDRSVQWIVEDELRRGIEHYRATSGSIIVMDPRTGAILAMASYPTYDPNALDKASPDALQNAAISAQYEPGSVFKVVTAAAALDTGVVTETQKLTDTGSIMVGDRNIFNSTRMAWGAVDMTEALARSLNVITSQWALLLGKDRFYQYVTRFGFGEVTEIDLAGEVYGMMKKPGWNDWTLSDLGTNSFGQGIAVTPLQMTNAVAAIANGGKLMRPYVVAARIDDGEMQWTQPTVIGEPIQASTAQTLTKVLIEVVNQGNSAARVAGYAIAGKSGTAQIPTKEGYTEDETIVTFVGYAPADDPRLVILVKMDRPDPTISQWANYTAAPVFAQVARRLFNYYKIPPDDVRLRRPTATN